MLARISSALLVQGLFSEQREKGRLPWRPLFGRFDVREARRLEFVDHDARRDTMSATIGGHALGI